mgnify:CR=1 FL=1|tara:strand:+ start:761 stop:1024 length:264 start_codon:yes stop_codon:yes gene_type:complete
MTLLQRQIYEANFNYIGQTLIKAYDKKKKNKESTKELSNLIKNLNEMYMFTNNALNELHIMDFKIKLAESDKLRAIERARKSEKLLK